MTVKEWMGNHKKTVIFSGIFLVVFLFGMYLSALLHPAPETRLILKAGIIVNKEQHVVYQDGARFIKSSAGIMTATKKDVPRSANYLLVRGTTGENRCRIEFWEISGDADFNKYRKNEIVYRDEITNDVIKRKDILTYIDKMTLK